MNRKLFLLLGGMCVLGPVSAQNTIDVNLTYGMLFTQFNGSQSIAISPEINKVYANNSASQTNPLAGLGIAYDLQQIGGQPFNLSLGLSAYYFNMGNIQGTTYAVINGSSYDGLNYSANASSTALFFEPKIVYTRYALQPYIIGGIGVAFNQISNYSETATGTAAPGEPYTNHTQNQTAYEIGAGFQYLLYESQNWNWLAGLDYRHFELGQGSLGPAAGQNTATPQESFRGNALSLTMGLQFK